MVRIFPLMVLLSGLIGCAEPMSAPGLSAPEPVIGGSAIRLAGDAVATPLVNHLVQVFESRLPGSPLLVEPPLGSAGARAALADGLLAGVLEASLPGERASAEGHLIARSAVVLVVGAGVRERRLALDELVALAGGRPGRWSNGLPRQLVLRPADDPLQRALVRALPALEAPLADAIAARRWPVYRRDATARDALRRPGVLGVADRGNLRLHGSPTWEVDVPGRQPAAVELRLVAREPMPPRLRAFLAFATGDEGRSLIADLGFEMPR